MVYHCDTDRGVEAVEREWRVEDIGDKGFMGGIAAVEVGCKSNEGERAIRR